MGHLDQTAFVVVARAPYAEWTATMRGPHLSPDELETCRSVYLIDDVPDLEPEADLRLHWREVFDRELYAWSEDRKTWPRGRTYEMFLAWFDVRVVEIVVKLDGRRPEDE